MRFTLPRDLYHGKGSLEELKAAIQTNGEQAKEVAAQVPPPYFPSRRQGRCAGESPA